MSAWGTRLRFVPQDLQNLVSSLLRAAQFRAIHKLNLRPSLEHRASIREHNPFHGYISMTARRVMWDYPKEERWYGAGSREPAPGIG